MTRAKTREFTRDIHSIILNIVEHSPAISGLVSGGGLTGFSTAKFLDDEQGTNPAHMNTLALLFGVVEVHLRSKYGLSIARCSDEGQWMLPSLDVFLDLLGEAAMTQTRPRMDAAQGAAVRAEGKGRHPDVRGAAFSADGGAADRQFLEQACTEIRHNDARTKASTVVDGGELPSKWTEYFGVLDAVDFVFRNANVNINETKVKEVMDVIKGTVDCNPQLQQLSRVGGGGGGRGRGWGRGRSENET